MPGARPSPQDDATTPLDAGGGRGGPLEAIVRVLEPTGLGSIRLGGGERVVGSGPEADLRIEDRTVSRRHCGLSLCAEGVRVRDLGSRNGTFYLDQRVEAMTLGLGATLRLGRALLAIEPDQGALGELPPFEGSDYRGVVGTSPAMRRLFAVLRRLEGSLATVLLEGESGAGKEVVARALHAGSTAATGPFVAINCGAIPKDLIASELFGHAKGAFTGASEARRGAFESADGGTLFLDELGELPLELQPVLLRALETGEIRPVGSDRVRKVRVRIVAATNRDLDAEVKARRFREDLYYRLGVVRLRLPPLRERPDDIEPLALRFAAQFGLSSLPSEALQQLRGRSWPGNVRELRNAVEAYAALGVLPRPGGDGEALIEAALRAFADPSKPYAEQKEALVERFARVYLAGVLERTGGNQSAAARISGLDRGYVGKLAAKLGLSTGRRGEGEGG